MLYIILIYGYDCSHEATEEGSLLSGMSLTVERERQRLSKAGFKPSALALSHFSYRNQVIIDYSIADKGSQELDRANRTKASGSLKTTTRIEHMRNEIRVLELLLGIPTLNFSLSLTHSLKLLP